jgi:REP element-mobilizing transposase RayT
LGCERRKNIIFYLVSEHIRKRHNKTLLLYHLVCPIKYRSSVLSDSVEITLIEVCDKISSRYEIGVDENHVHFSIQSVPMLSAKTIVKTIKSITAKEIFYFLNPQYPL